MPFDEFCIFELSILIAKVYIILLSKYMLEWTVVLGDKKRIVFSEKDRAVLM